MYLVKCKGTDHYYTILPSDDCTRNCTGWVVKRTDAAVFQTRAKAREIRRMCKKIIVDYLKDSVVVVRI